MLLPLQVFSQWGTYAVATLVASGFANIVFIRPASPWYGIYGEVLAVKMAIAFAIIVFACLNRWRVTPTLASGGGVLGLSVIAIVGQLGLLPPR